MSNQISTSEAKMQNIDVNFDFTSDTPDYRDDLKTRKDPDIWSPTLRKYQQILYSKKLPNGEVFELQPGENPEYNYLYWKNFRFGSDSIINTYTQHEKMQWLMTDVKDSVKDFAHLQEKYLRENYTIGGELLFSKRRQSINQCRGTNPNIKDRFDLTLECIRRYYENQDSPLSKVLQNDADFFQLFNNFKGYVDFFYLNDLVSEDYSNIKYYLEFDNFNRNPLPQTVDEWLRLYNSQMEFLRARNKRINESANKIY
jgi:hypothetical protein